MAEVTFSFLSSWGFWDRLDPTGNASMLDLLVTFMALFMVPTGLPFLHYGLFRRENVQASRVKFSAGDIQWICLAWKQWNPHTVLAHRWFNHRYSIPAGFYSDSDSLWLPARELMWWTSQCRRVANTPSPTPFCSWSPQNGFINKWQIWLQKPNHRFIRTLVIYSPLLPLSMLWACGLALIITVVLHNPQQKEDYYDLNHYNLILFLALLHR